MSSDEDDDVEIISTHDEKIKLIDEIFGNDSSKKILNLPLDYCFLKGLENEN